jgi:putative ABC transport system permease protein
MNLFGYTLREFHRRPGRMLLTLLGITLGLATIVATRLTIHTVHGAYRDLFASVAGGGGGDTLEVTAPGLSSFPAPCADELTSVRRVKAVAPRIRGAAGVVGRSGSVPSALIGCSDGAPAGWRLQRGRNLANEDEALIDDSLAVSLDLAPEQSVQLWTPAGLIALRLAGTVTPLGATAGSGGLVVVSLGAARRLLGLPALHVNSLWVILEDGSVVEEVQSDLAARLPAGLTVHPPSGHGALARSTLLAAEQGLTALGALALVAAAFVIFNTFLPNLGERKQHLALLKTLGATRRQVLRLLLVEALLLGAVGTMAGCLVGLGLSVLLVRAMARFLGTGLMELQFTPAPFLLAGLLGPLTPVIAACLPAWQASRNPPLRDLLGGRGETGESSTHLVVWPGLLLLVVGLVLTIGLCRGWLAPLGGSMLPVTLALLLAGAVLSFPLILAPMLRLFGGVPLGLIGKLARQQLERYPTRTGLTGGVLFLALAIAIGFGHSLRGILADLRGWYRQTIVADFLVRGSMPDATFALATALPETLAEELAKLPHVSAVDRIAFLPCEGNGRDVLLLARTFSANDPLPLDLREGAAGDVRQGLLRAEVVLGTGLAAQLGRHAGDDFILQTPRGPQRRKIAGTTSEFAGGGAAVYLEWHAAKRLFDLPGAHVLLVKARPAASQSLRPILQAFCRQHRLLLQSNSDLGRLIDNQVERVTGAIQVLLVLVFVVASLAVVNTLQMNIHDQVRTFGVLRAVGMKRGQLVRLVLAQAMMLGTLALVPGALVGLALAFLISRGSACWAGVPITFQLDVGILIGSSALAFASALLAALLPARATARLSVIEALR